MLIFPILFEDREKTTLNNNNCFQQTIIVYVFKLIANINKML